MEGNDLRCAGFRSVTGRSSRSSTSVPAGATPSVRPRSTKRGRTWADRSGAGSLRDSVRSPWRTRASLSASHRGRLVTDGNEGEKEVADQVRRDGRPPLLGIGRDLAAAQQRGQPCALLPVNLGRNLAQRAFCLGLGGVRRRQPRPLTPSPPSSNSRRRPGRSCCRGALA